jgi:23S rRNA (uracil1939-C5)-methyltransferase
MPPSVYGGVAAIEIAETIPGDARACHLELHAGVDASRYGPLAEGLSGLSAQRADSPAAEQLAGTPIVVDTVPLGNEEGSPRLRLQRDVRAFFQGNRFLLEPFVRHVASLVPAGPVLDLYAGVGLFGLALAALGRGPVTLVEGDPIGGADLAANARPLAESVHVHRLSVEDYLRAAGRCAPGTTAIVDPPRTGMSRDALVGLIDAQPSRIVYVSCDVATLARDTRLLLEAGFELGDITGVDLFPNTAHVESVVRFHRAN